MRLVHSCLYLLGCGCPSAQLGPCRVRSVTCGGSQPESPRAVGTKPSPRRSERSGDFPSVPRDASSWLPPEFQVAEAGQWTHMNKVVGIRIFLGGEVVEIGQVLVLRDRRRGHMRLGIPQRR